MICQMVETFWLACHPFLPWGDSVHIADCPDHVSGFEFHCITVDANCESFREAGLKCVRFSCLVTLARGAVLAPSGPS